MTAPCPAPPLAIPNPAAGLSVEAARVRFGGRVVLDAVSLAVPAGRAVGLAGASGSGKSTLLQLAAGLLRPEAGVVRWGETAISALGEAGRSAWRLAHAGFVFQEFHLVAELSALDNVLLPASFGRWREPAGLRARGRALLARMGVADPALRAGRLSRGEQQRVAIARALLGGPRVVFADEPTASLDAQSGAAVGALLLEAVRQEAASLLVVSHDPALLARLDVVWRLEHGRLSQVAA